MSLSRATGFGGGMGWSDLPLDLVNMIRDRLELIDYIRSGAVCSSWHNYSTTVLCRPQIPWLMFFSREEKTLYFYRLPEHEKLKKRRESLCFYCLSEHEKLKKREIFQPKLARCDGAYCFGSSNGYLIYLDEDDSNLHAANPITGAHLAFPPTTKLPNVVGTRKSSYNKLVDIVDFTTPEGEGKAYEAYLYYSTAILSPSKDTVAIIHGPCDRVAFARIGDDSWTNLIGASALSDMVFHKGRLHVVGYDGYLNVFDLDRPFDQPVRPMHGPICEWAGFRGPRVIESPDGEDLFLVNMRKYDFKIITKGFRVFVLDKTIYKWNPIESLGDITIFISNKCAVSLRTSEFPDLRRSCIYFFDDDRSASTVLSVFNLETGSIERIHSDLDLGRSQPIWFLPTLS